jgi:hypothetical protein
MPAAWIGVKKIPTEQTSVAIAKAADLTVWWNQFNKICLGKPKRKTPNL